MPQDYCYRNRIRLALVSLPILFVLLFSAAAAMAYPSTFTTSQACYAAPTPGANNDAIYDHIMNYHASTSNNSGVKVTYMQDDYVKNGSNYYIQIDFGVSISQTFSYNEKNANHPNYCEAGDMGRGTGFFPVSHVAWADYNNISQGGNLQQTYSNAYSVSTAGDPQILQTVGTNAPAPKGQNMEGSTAINETTGDNHVYVVVRVLGTSNTTGYNIVGINYFQDNSSQGKLKFWVDIIIDSSSTYTNSLPTGSHSHTLTLSAGATNPRWQEWNTLLKSDQCNTRGFAYSTYQGLPLIEQSAQVCT